MSARGASRPNGRVIQFDLLVKEAGATLVAIDRDVKIQVDPAYGPVQPAWCGVRHRTRERQPVAGNRPGARSGGEDAESLALHSRVGDAVGTRLHLDATECLAADEVEHEHRVVVAHGDEGMSIVGVWEHSGSRRLRELRQPELDRFHDFLCRHVGDDQR